MLNRLSLALLTLLLPAAALAQAPVNSNTGYTQVGGCPGTPAPPTCFTQYGSAIPITGSITATLGGFAPNGATAGPLSVSGTTSNVLMPVGTPASTVVVVSNVGATNTAYVHLGTSNAVTATTADIPIPPQQSIGLTIGLNTYLAAITSTSTTTLNIVGGGGLFSGVGGGGGSGGGGGTSLTDEATFTQGTTALTPIGGYYTTSPTALTTGQGGAARLTADRSLFADMQDWAGTALGAPSNYGTSPGAVEVPGVNAFITNTPAVTCAACATSANQSSQITQETATAGALGTTSDSAYTGSGNATVVAALKGLYIAPGQTTMSGSTPVVIASDQSALPENLTQVGGTTLLKGAGATGTGSPRETVAQDTTTIAGNAPASAGQGATGSAVPAGATYQGVNVGGNLTGPIGCGSSIVYDASTNGATQLVALSSGKSIYVCGYSIFSAGTVNVELDYGTATACATGNNKIVPAYQLTAQTGIVDSSVFYRGLGTPASQELCIKTSAGVAVQAIVYYTQF